MTKSQNDHSPMKNGQNEELGLVRRARLGDPSALAGLITHYLPRIQSKAGRYPISGLETEDLVQEGLIGLFKAIQTFDEKVGSPFGAYASLCMNHSIASAVRSALKGNNRLLENYVSIDHLHQLPDSSSCTPQSNLDPSQLFIQREQLDQLQEQMRTLLSSFEQDALRLYLNGLTYEEMASTLHATLKAVDNALQRVRRKLKAASVPTTG